MKNPNKTIKRLRDAGYEVKISHRRPIVSAHTRSIFGMRTRIELDQLRQEFPTEGMNFLTTGGETIATIVKDHRIIAQGRSICHEDDNFYRLRGLQAALGRAVKNLKSKGIILDTAS